MKSVRSISRVANPVNRCHGRMFIVMDAQNMGYLQQTQRLANQRLARCAHTAESRLANQRLRNSNAAGGESMTVCLLTGLKLFFLQRVRNDGSSIAVMAVAGNSVFHANTQ